MTVNSTLDLQALRTFVLGIELGSFALAAKRQCRSTSAVSAQLKKLEMQAQTKLVKKEGRHLQVTPQGELLLSYAKRLLALNDETLEALNNTKLEGSLSIAMQEDFREELLTELLGIFSRSYPQIQLSTMIGRYKALITGVQTGDFDFAMTWDGGTKTPFSENIKELPIQWLAYQDFAIEEFLVNDEPLPLVLFDSPCLFREKAIQSLDKAGIKWRIAYTSQSLSGIWAALKAGLGITVRSSVGLPNFVKAIASDLPQLGVLGVQIHCANEAKNEQTMRFLEIIKNRF